MKLRLYTFALLATAPVGSLLTAQETHSQETQSQGNELEQLSADSFASRQRATLEMWRVRDQSRQEVQRAAQHPDPEISGRAEWILRQWRRGSLPGTPPEISRLLARSSGTAGIDDLLVEGQFAAALVAVEESVGTIEYDEIKQRIHLSLLHRFPNCIGAAVKHQRLPELLELIDAVADSKEMAVARVQLMQEMGIDLATRQLLPRAAETWTETERNQAEALVLIMLGRLDQAIAVAERGSDKHFLYQCRSMAGRWHDAMNDAVAQASECQSGTAEHARYWSQAMVCSDRAGDVNIFQQAKEQLTTGDLQDPGSARDLRWRTLASHGEIDLAIGILDQFDAQASAQVSMDASRIEHALDVLGFPLHEVDGKIHQWVDAAIESQRQSIGQDPNKPLELIEPVSKLLTLIRCLIDIGYEDTARTAVHKLCTSDVRVGNLRLRDYVLSSLTSTRRSDWIIDFAIAEDETALSPVAGNIIADTLPNADASALGVVIEGLATIHREQSAREGVMTSAQDRIAAACMLFQGQVPDGFDPTTDFKELYDYAAAPRHLNNGRLLPGRAAIRLVPGQLGLIRANMNIVRLFLAHGQAEHASQILHKLIELGDHDALRLLAEQELDGGSTELALSLFDLLHDSASSRQPTARFGSVNEDVIAVESLVGKWTVAKRVGDISEADELFHEIRLAVCSPSTRLRESIAQYLADRNERELAAEIYQRLLPMTMLENEEGTGFYNVARAYSLLVREDQVGESARWYDLAICDAIGSSNFRAGAFISLPIYVRRWSVEAAMEQHDQPAAARHIDRIMNLDPMDIDLAERILPAMRKAGMTALADQTLDRIMDAGGRYTEQFPRDAMTANNLAWVAAMNGKHLDVAMKLAMRAVFLEPDSAIYRDTLAEILFRLDRKQEALQIEQACLLDDPTQWHLHQQVEKYRESVFP